MIIRALTILVAFVGISGSFVAIADESNHKRRSESKQPMPDMMDIGELHKHMEKLQTLMSNIRKSKNEKQRQDLMQEHMKEMHKGMNMMQGIMLGKQGSMMFHDMNKKTMAGIEIPIMERQQMMENRMDIMQMMMSQMMEHLMQIQEKSIHIK